VLPCKLCYRLVHSNRNSNTVTMCTVTAMAAVPALQTVCYSCAAANHIHMMYTSKLLLHVSAMLVYGL